MRDDFSPPLLTRARILPLELDQQHSPRLVRIDTAELVKTLAPACHHNTEPSEICKTERWDIELAVHPVLGISLAKRTNPLKVQLKRRVRERKRSIEHRVSRKVIVVVHKQSTGRSGRNWRRGAQSS